MKDTTLTSSSNDWWSFRRFVLILTVTVVALFPKVAIGWNTLFYRDFGVLGYPFSVFLRDSLLRGELPFWDPYSHCGVPFLAQMGTWYPTLWLSALLPMPWAVNFFVLLHLILGGAGAYVLTRKWGVGGFAASFAGFAYTFNGVSLSCFQWPNYIASLGLLPWVIVSVMETWNKGGRWIGVAAFVSALQVLTATPELTLMGWLFIGLLWAVTAFGKDIKPWNSAARTVTVVAIAAGITMVQMLPFFDLLANSQRDFDYDSGLWAMPGWGWANLFVPLFHCCLTPVNIWFQQGQTFLTSYYLGAGIMVLAIAGAVLHRTRLTLALAGMACFCWILSLGPEGYLYSWISRVFPYIRFARFFVKYTILTSLLIPALAAIAIEKVGTSNGKWRRWIITLVGIALAGMAFLLWFLRKYPFRYDIWSDTAWNTLWQAIIMIVLVTGVLMLAKVKKLPLRFSIQAVLLALIVIEAFAHNPRMVPTLPASFLEPGMWAASGKPPPPRLGEGRIMISPHAEKHLTYSTIERFDYDFAGNRMAEWSNLNLIDRIPKVNGAITLRPLYFDRIEQYLYYTNDTNYGKGIVDFMSAAWISSPENPVQWQARTDYLPVITAGQRPDFLNDPEALTAITTNSFDPRATVYLSPSARPFVTVSNNTACLVTNQQFTANRVDADVECSEASLVVLSQTFYHLWQAEVDGTPTPLLRANVAFQALQVPAGKHHVTLVYRDHRFVIGGFISLISLVVCGLVACGKIRFLRPPPDAQLPPK